jgi:hypothetical protein
MLQRTDATLAAKPNTSSKKHMKASTMKLIPPDASLKDYKKRRKSRSAASAAAAWLRYDLARQHRIGPAASRLDSERCSHFV